MIKVRKGCFETNSSSVHALVVSHGSRESYPHTIIFGIGEYGWSFETLDTMGERLSYFYTAACALRHYDVGAEIRKMLAPLGVDVVIVNHPNFVVWEKDGKPYLDNGYVDHCDELLDWVNRCYRDIEYFLDWVFGETSRALLGNDNCDEEELDPIENPKLAGNEECFLKGN